METVHETPGARILYQDTVRRGGVLGFFAREVHRVAYIGAGETVELADLINQTAPISETAPISVPGYESIENSTSISEQSEPSPFAALLADADAEEVGANRGRHHAAGGLDFASILSRYTAEAEVTEPTDSASTISLVPEPDVLADVTPMLPGKKQRRGAQARDRLELLMQLRQVGVPVSVNPGSDVQGRYQALEEILQQLPEPATLPNRPGQLLAIVGEQGPALRAARATAKLLRLPASEIVVAGLDQDAAGELRRINGRRQAARLRQEILESDLPAIVVVVTDGVGADDAVDTWTSDLLAALRADLTWAVIDARWKSEDCHRLLDRLGPVQALVVHAAQLSSSPASVWELDLPLALLDERRPSTFVWLSLLGRLFDPTTQAHHATA